ncbi:MAG: serine hydrolase [Chloroflexi bacterium]|nr:serine hydrolase [Chloroflexota bacterium]
MKPSFPTQLKPRVKKFSGTVGVYAERLDTGATLAFNADETFLTASVVKLPVLFELFRQVKNKTASLDERIALREADKVIGSGVLKELRAGVRFTLYDLVFLMMSISDNTAANMVTDRVGIANVNRTMKRLGLKTSRVTGKILIDQTHNTDTTTGKGERAPTTPREMAQLLKVIEARKYLGANYSQQIIEILKRADTTSTIARGLPYEEMRPEEGEPRIVVAHKTGSLRGTRNNVGLVYTPKFTYVIAMMSRDCKDLRWTADNEASVLLGEISRIVYEKFAK